MIRWILFAFIGFSNLWAIPTDSISNPHCPDLGFDSFSFWDGDHSSNQNLRYWCLIDGQWQVDYFNGYIGQTKCLGALNYKGKNGIILQDLDDSTQFVFIPRNLFRDSLYRGRKIEGHYRLSSIGAFDSSSQKIYDKIDSIRMNPNQDIETSPLLSEKKQESFLESYWISHIPLISLNASTLTELDVNLGTTFYPVRNNLSGQGLELSASLGSKSSNLQIGLGAYEAVFIPSGFSYCLVIGRTYGKTFFLAQDRNYYGLQFKGVLMGMGGRLGIFVSDDKILGNVSVGVGW